MILLMVLYYGLEDASGVPRAQLVSHSRGIPHDGFLTHSTHRGAPMAMEEIQVLSVRQPYADDIIYGTKWNELRSWSTPYRGPLYIHASRWDEGESESVGPGRVKAIIGRVELVDCIPEEDLLFVHAHLWRRRRLPSRLVRLAEFLKGFPQDSWEHGIGEWNWILVEPQPLATPIPKYGKLRIWQTVVDSNQLRLGKRPEPYVGPPRTAYPDPSAAT